MATMRRMIEMGEGAVAAGSDYDPEAAEFNEEDLHDERRTYLRDTITNIHHWADHHGLSWEEALDELHYEAEKGTDLDEEATA